MEFVKRMKEDLILHGMSERTQDSYIRSVRKLEEFIHKNADKVTEEELRSYFLYLLEVKKFSVTAFKIAFYGIRFYYTATLHRKWPLFDQVKPKDEKKLPVVLSSEEVRRILTAVRVTRFYAFLSTVYSCGLRLQEALNLQVGDISSDRMLLHIRNGKGARDRYVPLPQSTLKILRKYWITHQNKTLLFPALDPRGKGFSRTPNSMAKTSVQRAMKLAVADAGIVKKAHIHTLRHSYATHLLEQGISLKLIQKYLGHALIQTTLIYVHLTYKSHKQAYEKIDLLMKDL